MRAPFMHGVEVDGVDARVDACVGGVADGIEGGGDVEQRFGGDATAVEAGAARRGVAFDERHVQAELGSA